MKTQLIEAIIRSLAKEERELLEQQLFFDDSEPITYELMQEGYWLSK